GQGGLYIGDCATRAQDLQLVPELIGVLRTPGKEELELEQVTQPQRFLPGFGKWIRGLSLRQPCQSQLPHSAVDEEVDGAVSIEGGDEVLVRTDGVHRLEALPERFHDTTGLERLERAQKAGLVFQQGGLSHRQPAHLDVVEQWLERVPDLGQG